MCSVRTLAGRLATPILVVVAAGLTFGAGQSANRVAAIHQHVVFADMHAHPSRFHRANVPSIEPDELARYRRGLIDIVVCNISTDAVFSGDYVKRDGTDVKRGELPRPKPGEPFAFTLDRFARITKTIDDGDAVLATSPEAVLDAKRQGKLALLAALEGGDGLEARVENLRDLYRRGLRLLQLVHFRANELGHIQTYPYSPGGLTPFGREAVHEANRLGIIIDLAHANTETIMDALKESSQPVLFSHTGVKALHDGERYLPTMRSWPSLRRAASSESGRTAIRIPRWTTWSETSTTSRSSSESITSASAAICAGWLATPQSSGRPRISRRLRKRCSRTVTATLRPAR